MTTLVVDKPRRLSGKSRLVLPAGRRLNTPDSSSPTTPSPVQQIVGASDNNATTSAAPLGTRARGASAPPRSAPPLAALQAVAKVLTPEPAVESATPQIVLSPPQVMNPLIKSLNEENSVIIEVDDAPSNVVMSTSFLETSSSLETAPKPAPIPVLPGPLAKDEGVFISVASPSPAHTTTTTLATSTSESTATLHPPETASPSVVSLSVPIQTPSAAISEISEAIAPYSSAPHAPSHTDHHHSSSLKPVGDILRARSPHQGMTVTTATTRKHTKQHRQHAEPLMMVLFIDITYVHAC